MTFSFRPNGGTLRALLTVAAAFLIALCASAQMRAVMDLQEVYGLSHVQGKLTVSQVYTSSEAAAKFPRAAQVCTARGYNFMQLSCFDAAWMDAVWQGQGGGQPVGGVLASQNHVIVPPGEYWQTVPAEFSGGEYLGAGPGYPLNGSVNTTLVIWHERWQGDPTERNCLQAATYKQSGIFSYIEGTRIQGFQLIGRQKEFPSVDFHSSGIMMWKPGEVTYTTDIFARDFRTYGIEMHAPTPHHLGTISVFDNVVGGVAMVGGWGGTVNIDEVSGDDNGAMLVSVPGYGQEAGGTWNVGVIKYETGVASGAGSERVWRGMAVGVFHGQFGVNIGAVSAAQGAIGVDALFIVDPRLTAGWVQGSMLRVGPTKGFTYASLVHDLRGERFTAWPSYTYGTFTWHANGTWEAIPSSQKVTGYHDVRQNFNISGPFIPQPISKPYRHLIDGPPNAPVPVYLDELTGTPTEPTDPTPPTPTDPDPLPGGVLAELVNEANTSPVRSVPVNWAGATRIVFEGVTFDATGFQRFAWVNAADNRGVVLKSDGYFYTPSNVKVGPKITAGTRYDRVELVFASPVDLTFYLSKPGVGAALNYSADKVTIFGQ